MQPNVFLLLVETIQLDKLGPESVSVLLIIQRITTTAIRFHGYTQVPRLHMFSIKIFSHDFLDTLRFKSNSPESPNLCLSVNRDLFVGHLSINFG